MSELNRKKAIVVGASSGIGRELAKALAADGYAVGLVARRLDELNKLNEEIGGGAHVKQIDVANEKVARQELYNLILEMGGAELIVVNAGYGYGTRELVWEAEKQAIEVNVLGFAAMSYVAFHHFCERGGGHLVGVSSIAALMPGPVRPAYNASKAFISSYLRSLRLKARKLRKRIVVTDIKPGFVDTPMTEGAKGIFWVASSEKAARQILEAIKSQKPHAYVTQRWRLAAWLMHILPDSVYEKVR